MKKCHDGCYVDNGLESFRDFLVVKHPISKFSSVINSRPLVLTVNYVNLESYIQHLLPIKTRKTISLSNLIFIMNFW